MLYSYHIVIINQPGDNYYWLVNTFYYASVLNRWWHSNLNNEKMGCVAAGADNYCGKYSNDFD